MCRCAADHPGPLLLLLVSVLQQLLQLLPRVRLLLQVLLVCLIFLLAVPLPLQRLRP